MSNTRCESFHWMTPIYVLCIAMGLWLPRLERLMLYLLFIVTTLAHWHYGTSVVTQMCEHFNRICFSVHMRQPADDDRLAKTLSTTTSCKVSTKENCDKITTATITTTTINTNTTSLASSLLSSAGCSSQLEESAKKLQ